ncbi:MAG: KilA-N domain-containing protein [Saprospiraceae bacterium]|nr:KilA-N domain-containing protein [Saprospiraceae bacterium]
MIKQKLTVKGLTISVEQIHEKDYISLTDIAKQDEHTRSSELIRNWMKNSSTLEYLAIWEQLHNPNFNSVQMDAFKLKASKNRYIVNPKTYIEETGAIGLISKTGRYDGGTLAHKDIAFNFCYWLEPAFQLYVAKEFDRLKAEEFSMKSLEWHLTKITSNIDEVRNLLDTIPGQRQDLNRQNFLKDAERDE